MLNRMVELVTQSANATYDTLSRDDIIKYLMLPQKAYGSDDVGTNTVLETNTSKLTEAIGDSNSVFMVSHQAGTAQIGLKQKQAVKDTTEMTTIDAFASYIELSTVKTHGENGTKLDDPVAGRGLTLQIGDTADSYNQLKVNIKDCHTKALGLDSVSIANQGDAAEAAAVEKLASIWMRGVSRENQRRNLNTLPNPADNRAGTI